jgi:translation initiation factor 5A
MMVPNVVRKDYQLNDISDDGFLSVMDDSGETREDLKLPEGEVGEEIKTRFAAYVSSFSAVFLSLSCSQLLVVKMMWEDLEVCFVCQPNSWFP